MYQALYRKYRPKKLDDIVGQEVIVKIIKNSLKNNKISHAYIFCGPRGTGKTTMAKLLAKYVNCLNLKGDNCCNKCKNCQEIDNNQSVDILEIDAASNNGVEEIRELRSKINLIPSSLNYKVYIIDEVHMLSSGAFNALLKTLEEPPKHVIFILATTDVQKIPLTILSRCQTLYFNKINENCIKKNIIKICQEEKITIDEEAASEIARCSDGGMRDAIGLLDKIISYGNRTIVLYDIYSVNGILSLTEIISFVDDIFNNNIENIMKKLTLYDEQGKNLEKLVEDIINLLTEELHNEFVNHIQSKYDQNRILTLLETLNMTIYNMKNVNSSKLLLEIELIKNIKAAKIISREIILKEKDEEKLVEVAVNKLEISEKNHDDEYFNQLKLIRINNTFAEASKEILKKFSEKYTNILTYKLDSKYNKAANILTDGTIRVASDNYVIFSFPYSSIVESAEENIEEIGLFLEKLFGKKLKLVFLTDEEWKIEKEKYILNKKNGVNYNLINEELNIKSEKNKKTMPKKITKEEKEVMDLLGSELVEIK